MDDDDRQGIVDSFNRTHRQTARKGTAMGLPTKNRKDRAGDQSVKIQVWGMPKIGKTFMAGTLPEEKTLFLDAEKGMLSLGDWDAESMDILDWQEAKNLACYLAGPSRVAAPGKTYSMAHYKAMVKKYGDPDQLKKYDHVYIDSTTLIGQYAFAWCKQQPEAFNKKGEPNLLGAYGLLGTELMDWAWRLQAIKRMNVILIGGIKHADDGDIVPLLDGSAANKLLYVFDEIVSYAFIEFDDDGKKTRSLVCKPDNEHGYPAGDRSGKLDMYEEPDMLKLIKKIKGG